MAHVVPAEIEWALQNFLTEPALEQYLASLGCEYWADPAEGGCRTWLTEIARRVGAATGTE